MDANDPREIIFSFLDDLPTTIRTEALLFLMMYAMESDVPEDSNAFTDPVKRYLMRSGIPRISAVVCAIAAIDHSFEGMIARLDRSEVGLKILAQRRPESLGIQRSNLSFPMRRRHWEQAWEQWKDLKASKLGRQNILDFSDSQLSPQQTQ